MSQAFALAVLAVGLLSGMDALAILIAIAVVRPPRPRLESVLANGWRAVLNVATSLTFYFALSRLPLAETLALSLLSPCFTVLFGALLLRERVGRPVIIGLIVGFLGMLVIVSPNFGGASASVAALEGTFAVLLSTLAYSLSLVLLRSRATRDHVMTIVAVQNVGSALILGLLAPLVPARLWVPLASSDLVDFAGIGLLGVVGHLVIAKAYSLAPAGRMALADYTALIFGAIYGYLFFAETPAWTTIAGALLIIASSLIATRR
jgi:drug/metabolite transporter (DMT)-like permease